MSRRISRKIGDYRGWAGETGEFWPSMIKSGEVDASSAGGWNAPVTGSPAGAKSPGRGACAGDSEWTAAAGRTILRVADFAGTGVAPGRAAGVAAAGSTAVPPRTDL